jgi:thiosulfate/3-mercaptopyruvate sulfurtransferase
VNILEQMMSDYSDIIEVHPLAELLADEKIVIVDCRFYLGKENAGRQVYMEGHIPSAQYVHLTEDLSGPLSPGSGRHPLPSEDSMIRLFSNLGISSHTQVIAYDDAKGIAASRLWWMLRYFGHDKVAVLNGGIPAWKAAGLPLVPGVEEKAPVIFEGETNPELLIQMEEVKSVKLLVDSRLPERYRGEIEPIDPIAGHIPRAINFYYQKNYDEDGRLLSPSIIRKQFESLLGEIPPSEAAFYCGSGVTACNNLLALAYSGLGNGKHYVGSWSEWVGNPLNPIALGE